VPAIIGGEVFDGFVGGTEADATAPVAAELAGLLVPPELVAVSCTRIV
jgi:hypothetical protein